ncbi:hypothetical protein BMS77_04390 [Leuconostoc pseudomesenteroides]|nr:glycosyltransferase family 2 protein [Leuconostoc falkenbergense]OQJ72325.1 hypothetical protein BMS77_04390 [Leuconostoc pseudomesenteroides]MCT4419681.1 glycosyltransferase family 2 protein [Leuconostoc falkenbergense]OQJ74743.1 hypothetical protein BMS83_09360 [Leuconostoc pseudomesenteroides]OQJ78997.1 hypothetical protein BMS82_00430 [Leuconostoc pseudomesenteroides]ORI38603.1 hypothetical protein BMR88_01430 [Leuconostoc pseudomesenteroides]
MGKVSVIIPVFNRKENLKSTIKSLKAQSFFDSLEIIIIDDGSSENIENVLSEVFPEQSQHVKYFRYEKNFGFPTRPRNKGLELATGEYVFFMDSDDNLSENAIKNMYDIAEDEKADIVIPKQAHITKNGVLSKIFPSVHLASKDFMINHIEDMPLNAKRLFKKEFLLKHRILFKEDMYSGEDGEFFLHALLNTKRVSLLDDEIYYYNVMSEESILRTGLAGTKYTMSTIDDKLLRHKYFFENLLATDSFDNDEKILLMGKYFQVNVLPNVLKHFTTKWDMNQFRNYSYSFNRYVSYYFMKNKKSLFHLPVDDQFIIIYFDSHNYDLLRRFVIVKLELDEYRLNKS